MKKDTDILRIILNLMKGIDKDVKYLRDEISEEEIAEYKEAKIPICIPPAIYKKICKELGSKSIRFMGIS